MNRVYSLLGFAQRASKLASGETAAMIAVRKGSAKLLIVADDVSQNTAKPIIALAKRRNIPVMLFGTKESLGRAIGKSPRSVLAVEDDGFARTIHTVLREEN